MPQVRISIRIGIRIDVVLSRTSPVQIRSKAARYCLFWIRFSRKSKDEKPFKGPSWYTKPTDVAVKSETVKSEGSGLSPGWIELLSVRWLLVCGSMPDWGMYFWLYLSYVWYPISSPRPLIKLFCFGFLGGAIALILLIPKFPSERIIEIVLLHRCCEAWIA